MLSPTRLTNPSYAVASFFILLFSGRFFFCLSTKPSLSSSEPFTSTMSSDVSLTTKREKEKGKKKKKKKINEETGKR